MAGFAHWGLLEWGLVVSFAVALLALWVAVHSLKLIRRQAQQNEQLLQRIARDIAASNNGTVGMGQRLLIMEKRLQAAPNPMSNESGSSYSAHSDDEFKPYAEAAQLFKLGHSVDEVARRCHLSRAEASLLEVMQKN